MVTRSQVPDAKPRLSAKHALFVVLGVMTLYILYFDEGFFFHHESDAWQFFYPVRIKLFFHAAGGAIALVVGALQFSTRLRERRPKLHHWLGRTYFGGVLVAAPVAVYLGFTHALAVMATGTAVQGSLWVVTTWMAVRAARNRNFEVHQQWAIRSYAVTLLFVANRIMLDVPILGPKTDVGAERLAWILMVCVSIVAQLIIDREQLLKPQGPTPPDGFAESPSKPWLVEQEQQQL